MPNGHSILAKRNGNNTNEPFRFLYAKWFWAIPERGHNEVRA